MKKFRIIAFIFILFQSCIDVSVDPDVIPSGTVKFTCRNTLTTDELVKLSFSLGNTSETALSNPAEDSLLVLSPGLRDTTVFWEDIFHRGHDGIGYAHAFWDQDTTLLFDTGISPGGPGIEMLLTIEEDSIYVEWL